MDIVVCVKQVPSEVRIKSDFTIGRGSNGDVLNPFDYFAMEAAIRLKEEYGAHIITLSMGVISAAETLRTTIALGAEKAILLNDKAFAGSDTQATSFILGTAIRKISRYDIIVCGKQASDSDTGQVGVSIAEKLGIPCLSNVTEIYQINDREVLCHVLSEYGYMNVQISMPCVLCITKGKYTPRLPSVRGIIKSRNTKIEILDFSDIEVDVSRCGLSGSATKVIKCEKVTHPKVATKWIDMKTESGLSALLEVMAFESGIRQ
jgi:electron transfer flavoprotein beta subunit